MCALLSHSIENFSSIFNLREKNNKIKILWYSQRLLDWQKWMFLCNKHDFTQIHDMLKKIQILPIKILQGKI